MNNSDWVDSNGMIKLIANEVFSSTPVIPSIWKPIRFAAVIERLRGRVPCVARTCEGLVGVCDLDGVSCMLVWVELDLIDYPRSWKMSFVHNSPKPVTFGKKKVLCINGHDKENIYTLLPLLCFSRRGWKVLASLPDLRVRGRSNLAVVKSQR